MTRGSGDDLIDGKYRLIRQVGRGGMGVVWQARNELLDRLVAIKQLDAPPGTAPESRAGRIERVKREARVAARLDHPGIVRVYDVIDWHGLPAIVMEYVAGGSLATRIDESGPLSVEETARLGVALLDALRHAHDAGVVHRDLKPDNILLDGTRAVITDFGIARPMERATTLTMPGAMIGTPLFMAPEQIEGKQATTASDLWSLGVTLYTAVEGTLPFQGETIAQVCVAILTQPLRPPRSAGPLTPLLRALLTKDPAQRATAESAAARVAAIDGAAPRAMKPPAVSGVATMPLVVPGVAAPQSSEAISPTAVLEDDAGPQESASRRWRSPLALFVAGTGVVAAIIATLPGSPGTPPSAGAAAEATIRAKLTSPNKSAPDAVAFSPNGTTLVTTANNGGIYLWDTASGKLTAALTSPDNNIALQVVAFAPNGTTLATADGNSSTYLWDTATGKLTATLTDPNLGDNVYPGAGVGALAFSPNGKTLASADRSGNIYLWNTVTQNLTATLTDPDEGASVGTMAFAPNSTTLAVGDNGGHAYLWDTATAKLTATLTDPSPGNTGSGTIAGTGTGAVAFSPNGTTLAVGDGNTYLWNLTTRKLTATLAEPKAADNAESAEPGTLAFAPDGATLAVGAGDAITYLWDTTTRKITATLADDDYSCCGIVTAVAFAPTGSTLATAYSYGSTYLWHITAQKP